MGAFLANPDCKDNPAADGWYNVFYYGGSSEQVILACNTWAPKTMYYGFITLGIDENITWIKIAQNKY